VTLEIVGGSKVTLNPLKLNGDYGKIIESGSKKITYDIDEDLYDKEVFATLTVKQKNVLDNEILTMASMTSMPQYSYGLMLGSVKKFGGYAKFRSDFNSGEYSYVCNSAGEVVGGGYMWASGSQRKYRMQATAGVIFRLSKWCYPYLGTGYGIRSVHWQDYNGQWAQVSDYSCKGIAAEAGLIIKMGPVAVSAGVSTTAFRYTELEVGIGLML
jgi:opacity protein-like surface antigen